jgi:hypothetical protein
MTLLQKVGLELRIKHMVKHLLASAMQSPLVSPTQQLSQVDQNANYSLIAAQEEDIKPSCKHYHHFQATG